MAEAASERVLLDKSVARDDFQTMAYDAGWHLENIIRAAKDRPAEVIWLTNEGDSVHFIYDDMLGMPYALSEGRGRRRLAEYIRSKLPTISTEEVIREARKAKGPKARVNALHHVAAVAAGASFNKQLFDLIKNGFEDDEPEVRRAAVLATGYAEWPRFQKLLEERAAPRQDDAVP